MVHHMSQIIWGYHSTARHTVDGIHLAHSCTSSELLVPMKHYKYKE